MDQSKVEASSKSKPEELTAVAANDQDSDEASFTIEDADDFEGAISRQAAARVARYANRPPLTDDELRRAIRELERQEHLLRLRPFKLALKVFIGALIVAGFMSYMLMFSRENMGRAGQWLLDEAARLFPKAFQ
jgi:hypothetical protein